MEQGNKTKRDLLIETDRRLQEVAQELFMARAALEKKNKALQSAEQEILNSFHRLNTVVQSVGEGITLSDARGKFYIYNPRMQELTGYTLEEAESGGDFTRLLYPQPLERQKALQRLQELVEHKATLPLEVETTIQAKDGAKKVFWVSTVKMRFKDQEMFLSVYHDITERKRMEEEKRRLEERSRKIVEDIFRFIPEGILVFSRKMELLRQNQAFRELVSGYARRLGFAEDELENLILDKIKAGLRDNNIKEIRIAGKHETGKQT